MSEVDDADSDNAAVADNAGGHPDDVDDKDEAVDAEAVVVITTLRLFFDNIVTPTLQNNAKTCRCKTISIL